ncbi:MAG TPA: hypothetical protein VLT60_02305 [Usitatibacter sp.]|nr:hypothetical protein [Usitatibacter sp.]
MVEAGLIERRSAATLLAVAALLGPGSAAAFLVGPLPDPQVTQVVEYRNDISGHYFLAALPADFTAIDSGAAGPGWHTTGFRFGAFVPGAGRAAGEVCRFYAPSPNSHFYTANPDECNLLIGHPEYGWIYEGVKFEIAVPVDGACAAPLMPIRRLYNNRFQYNDSAHRYVFDSRTADALVAAGWIDEGVAFCSASTARVPAQSFEIAPTSIGSRADCENEDVNTGTGCIGLDGMPASLPNRIGPYLPPFYVTGNPLWSSAYSGLTGFFYDIFTAQDPASQPEVKAHSFVQMPRSPTMGFHLSSIDRTAPDIASMDAIYQFKTRAPQAGAADERLFPWRRVSPDFGYLELAFLVNVPTFVGGGVQGQAWGHPMLEFRDTASGQSIDVTLQTFGSVAPADFAGIAEPQTGNVFVSTVYRANPAFGERVLGDFTPCPAAVCGGSFAFRLRRADFETVIATARQFNPALSTQPDDYILVNYRFRIGVLGSAEVGAMVSGVSLTIY